MQVLAPLCGTIEASVGGTHRHTSVGSDSNEDRFISQGHPTPGAGALTVSTFPVPSPSIILSNRTTQKPL